MNISYLMTKHSELIYQLKFCKYIDTVQKFHLSMKLDIQVQVNLVWNEAIEEGHGLCNFPLYVF